MNLLIALLALATAVNGRLSGLNVDTALVKLPARRRIGAVAYATFARGNDLGNGLFVYPLLGISAALLALLTTVLAFVARSPQEVLILLTMASLLSILHTLATTRAALLMAKLDRFASFHTVRATFQVLAFFVLLWALAIV
jgi:hypothetical protein